MHPHGLLGGVGEFGRATCAANSLVHCILVVIIQIQKPTHCRPHCWRTQSRREEILQSSPSLRPEKNCWSRASLPGPGAADSRYPFASMPPYDVKTIKVSSAEEQRCEAVLILQNLEEGTVLVIEGYNGSCALPASRASCEVGIDLTKSFNLDLDFTFLRKAFQEEFRVRYCKMTETLNRCVWVAELQGSRRTAHTPYKWVPLKTVKVTHPNNEVCDAIQQELQEITEGFQPPRRVAWGLNGMPKVVNGYVKLCARTVMKCVVC